MTTSPATTLETAKLGIESSPADRVVEAACYGLTLGSLELIDRGRAASLPEIFTADGSWKLGDNEMDRAGIESWSAQREADAAHRSRHLLVNYHFERLDESTAAATANVLLFHESDDRAPGVEARSLARLQDAYARTEAGRWRIQRREMALLAGSPR